MSVALALTLPLVMIVLQTARPRDRTGGLWLRISPMPESRSDWRSIHGRVFTASGKVYPAMLSRHPDDSSGTAVWIDDVAYRPGDQFDGDRIIGFSTFDGSGHELVALFNAEARRRR
jgi:hypothetical protein